MCNTSESSFVDNLVSADYPCINPGYYALLKYQIVYVYQYNHELRFIYKSYEFWYFAIWSVFVIRLYTETLSINSGSWMSKGSHHATMWLHTNTIQGKRSQCKILLTILYPTSKSKKKHLTGWCQSFVLIFFQDTALHLSQPFELQGSVPILWYLLR